MFHPSNIAFYTWFDVKFIAKIWFKIYSKAHFLLEFKDIMLPYQACYGKIKNFGWK